MSSAMCEKSVRQHVTDGLRQITYQSTFFFKKGGSLDKYSIGG